MSVTHRRGGKTMMSGARRRTLAGVGALAVLLTACAGAARQSDRPAARAGEDPGGTDLAALSPTELLDRAGEAVADAGAVRSRLLMQTDSTILTSDFHFDHEACTGLLETAHGSATFLAHGEDAWLMPDEEAWRVNAAAGAGDLPGRYLHGTRAELGHRYFDVASACDLDGQLRGDDAAAVEEEEEEGDWSRGEDTTFRGQAVTSVLRTESDRVSETEHFFLIASEGEPYLLLARRIFATRDGQVTAEAVYSDFGVPVEAEEPPAQLVVEFDQLDGVDPYAFLAEAMSEA
ncbi:hypothetical protein [Streptomyces profundus]|uniref:hypothetical protein n=1 Tax=Streptomyces profundus TaxID=2867410 RepID=UPI001D168825|nr:hypothetical protein [Streptomyces sp. MA3_2.13]UED82853.1 hypothetical protein K4G22_00500 [Streptomyces sp. MA3_2.13]